MHRHLQSSQAMPESLDQQLDTIERNNKGWRSISHYDRPLLQQLSTCLQACLTVAADDVFLDLVLAQRTRAFDLFEYVAAYLIKHWHNQPRSFALEQLDYLALVGAFNRRLALTLQNDYDDDEKAPTTFNIEHQTRVRELLVDDDELFDILIRILPTVSENETNFIRMIIPWYEALIHFEHSNIDLTLDTKFNRFNANIIQCLISNEYNRSLIIADKDQTMITSVRHRFYLGTCTMAMGIHVNCEQGESDEAKQLLESYLTRYRIFIHNFVSKSHDNSSDAIDCLAGIVTYLVNYTLIIDNNDDRQLLVDLFSIVLNEQFYTNIRHEWSTNETILLDSIICYLIIYCFDNQTITIELLQRNDATKRYIQNLEKLVQIAEKYANRRIVIMSQLFMLVLSTCTQNQKFSDLMVITCLNYIQTALERNQSSYHYNRIPLSMFLRSLVNVVKYESVQNIIENEYLEIFIRIIINSEQEDIENDFVYQECSMIAFDILWSLSFNQNIKNKLKNNEHGFIEIVQQMNATCMDSTIKQSTCGLLYNLDRLDVSHIPIMNGHNFGKTIGISHDGSDYKTVQMIETELNKVGHRVWTIYDHMDDHFMPSFVTCMNSTEFLIVCLSDMYRLNNRCRAELLHATSHGHSVISWKVRPSTQNAEDDETIRVRGIKALLDRISMHENLPPAIDENDVRIEMLDPYSMSNSDSYRRRRTGELMNIENWSKCEVQIWSQTLNSLGFSKLLSVYDGQSLVKLYEFSKRNSTETVALLNRDLRAACVEDNIPNIQISVHEFIQFQIEIEKLISPTVTATLVRTSSTSLSNKKRLRAKICTLL